MNVGELIALLDRLPRDLRVVVETNADDWDVASVGLTRLVVGSLEAPRLVEAVRIYRREPEDDLGSLSDA